MAEISNALWSETDASNNAASPNGWAPGTMLPSQVEPTAQAMMGAIKRSWDRANCAVTTTGVSGTYVYAPINASYPASIVQGEMFGFYAHQNSAGNDTFKINGTAVLGPYNIYVSDSQYGLVQISASDIVANSFVILQYQSSLGGMLMLTHSKPTAAIIQQAFKTVLPAQPGGTAPYKLISIAGVASWSPDSSVYTATNYGAF